MQLYMYTYIATDLYTQVVQEGASLAPAWTEAMFHELLDQEASPASGAALHHAADIMSLYDTAKTRHCMAGMQQSISGGPNQAMLCTHAHTYTSQLGVAAFLLRSGALPGDLRHATMQLAYTDALAE